MPTLKELRERLAGNTAPDLKFYKVPRPIKKFNSIKKNMVRVAGTNYMADLLMLPKTSKGFQYLLVVVDLATDGFDIEPMKEKGADDTVVAFKKMLRRKYIKLGNYMTTDNGNEFKGSFDKYLKDEDVYHKFAMPYRHTQMANVERLNKELATDFNIVMNRKEQRSKKVNKEWTDAIPMIREDLNQIRTKEVPEYNPLDLEQFPVVEYDDDPKYNEGDYVHYALQYPHNSLNNKQNTANFRAMDKRFSNETKKIERVVMMQDEPHYRYILNGMPDVMWYEQELMPSDEQEVTYNVKKIIDKKKVGNRIEYLVWYKGELRRDAIWIPRKQLIEDGLQHYIRDYEDN